MVRCDATRNECWKLCSPDGFVSQTRPELSVNSLELLVLNMSGIENTTQERVCGRRAELWEILFYAAGLSLLWGISLDNLEQNSWGVNDHPY